MAVEQTRPVRNRDATRNAILSATSELIAEKGVDGFAMSEVATRGNINRALIYHHFKNRENLVFESIRHITHRYEAVGEGTGADPLERSTRMHIDHPEIARFIFHLLLNGQPLPGLSTRLVDAIEGLERANASDATPSPIDPQLAVIGGWLLQLAWSVSHHEMARLLGITVEEADERMIAHLGRMSRVTRGSLISASETR
jgi:AcrR family transcriptional regulator